MQEANPAGASVSACDRLEMAFARCFARSENTLLVGGADEPLYQPATTKGAPNLLYYREDYFASALHEIAHWCIAGVDRRQQVDFGYWYAPEGRNAAQQRAFEAVEVKPQALEWFFSLACGHRFRVSVDNFGPQGDLPDTSFCRQQVAAQARAYQAAGLPQRAGQLYRVLAHEFGGPGSLDSLRFNAADLA